MTSKSSSHPPFGRTRFFVGFCYFFLLVIIGRLFYWQVLRGTDLQAFAQGQYASIQQSAPLRGKILTADGYPLVTNQKVYRLFALPREVEQTAVEITPRILPILLTEYDEYQQASDSAIKSELETKLSASMSARISNRDRKWISLWAPVSEKLKLEIEKLQIKGLGFDPYFTRDYPEASMAAQVTGFVGKNEGGEEVGYFGIEGSLDKELRGKTIEQLMQQDAHGFSLFFTDHRASGFNGRDVVLTLRRDLQHLAEEYLERGITKYGAKSGEIVILDPATGDILALAAWPSYTQSDFYEYDPSYYKNPSVIDTYEPGSTFKSITVAAGIDAGVIQAETTCDNCEKAKTIGGYTIRTWNDEYHPNISMTEALAKSDNIAMIFIQEKIGTDRFYEYVEKFGIGQKLHLDLQEDSDTPYERKRGQVGPATNSFGQGIVTTSLQLVRAVATIANQGVMMRPRIVAAVINPTSGERIETKPQIERRVISPEAAQTTTQMLVAAAEAGEAQWTRSATHTIAGKTGTSQVAVDGKYDETKTITSFIGYAPADHPKFVMLVKLVEPTSSPWAAETAAPLWYLLANRLFIILNIPPDKQG